MEKNEPTKRSEEAAVAEDRLFGAPNFPLRPLLEEIPALARCGADYLELTLDVPRVLPQMVLQQKQEIEAALKQWRLDLPVAHMPVFVWTADFYENIRRASVDNVLEAMEGAARLNVEGIVLHPGYLLAPVVLGKERGERLAMKSLEEMIARATELGLAVYLENMFPRTNYLVEAEDFVPVLEAFPRLQLTLDIGHAHIETPQNRAFAFLERWADRIGHVHLSDNTGKEDQHLPLGVGTVPLEGIVRELKRTGYSGRFTVEVFSPDRDYLKLSLQKARNLWTRV